MKVSDRITSPGGTRAYPVLPLRDIVVFPHVIAPVGVALQWSWPQVRIVVPYSDEKIPVLCRKFPVHSKKIPCFIA